MSFDWVRNVILASQIYLEYKLLRAREAVKNFNELVLFSESSSIKKISSRCSATKVRPDATISTKKERSNGKNKYYEKREKIILITWNIIVFPFSAAQHRIHTINLPIFRRNRLTMKIPSICSCKSVCENESEEEHRTTMDQSTIEPMFFAAATSSAPSDYIIM